MKPFNLEAAKAGAKVVTRDGRDVRILALDLNCKGSPVVAAVHTGHEEYVEAYSEDGSYFATGESCFDLMMEAVKKEFWINTYPESSISEVISRTVYADRLTAKLEAAPHCTGQTKVTWEE
jgi:hypothetical protein